MTPITEDLCGIQIYFEVHERQKGGINGHGKCELRIGGTVIYEEQIIGKEAVRDVDVA